MAKLKSQRLRKQRRVALIVETSNAYARGLLDGVADYIRDHDPWSVYLPEQGRGGAAPNWLRGWDGDGVIARIENEAIAAQVKACKLPVVDLSAARLLPALPWVETDDREIADLAFAHLTERGFKNFGFYGDPTFKWSNGRRDRFVALAKDTGFVCQIHEMPSSTAARLSWDEQQQRLSKWLLSLPRPTGVFACYDVMAQRLLDACRRSDIAVPEEIAVIGVDNDTILCRLADPPLSSVAPDTHRTGYAAATLLDRMMKGEPVETTSHLIKPRGIETRQSTDVLAIPDPTVADTLRFIREHACDGISVKDVLGRTRLSRRMLETRFRALVGHSPHEELLRVRIARVKTLLRNTDLTIAAIAERTGYTHIEYLSAQFTRLVGQAPSRYRGQHQR